MVLIYCENETCENKGGVMEAVGDDSNDGWYEGYYECHICNQKKIHRREFNNDGTISNDEITLDDSEE